MELEERRIYLFQKKWEEKKYKVNRKRIKVCLLFNERIEMKFHWMVKENLNVPQLKRLIGILDEIGYESMLLTFHSDEPDYIIKAANAHLENQKTKFMFAVRPYAITPRYLSMIMSAFDTIQINNIYINIIAGTFDEDAQKFECYDDIGGRKEACADFALKLRSHMSDFNLDAKIFFSGSSDKTVDNVNRHGDGIISLVNSVNHSDKTNIARCWLLIRDTDDEAEAEYNLLEGRTKNACVYGSENTVYNKLIATGIEEFLISPANTNDQRVHNFVKSVLTDQQRNCII